MKNKYDNYLKLIGNNRIIIYQYTELIDIDNDKIELDNFIIYGLNLRIIKMDDDKVEIMGNIKKIEIE